MPTRPCREGGYGDLVAVLGPRQLLIEAEMSSRRIANDLQKALDLGATWLWILVPNCRLPPAPGRQWDRNRVVSTAFDLTARGKLVVDGLISHRFSFSDAAQAFELIDLHPEQCTKVILQFA